MPERRVTSSRYGHRRQQHRALAYVTAVLVPAPRGFLPKRAARVRMTAGLFQRDHAVLEFPTDLRTCRSTYRDGRNRRGRLANSAARLRWRRRPLRRSGYDIHAGRAHRSSTWAARCRSQSATIFWAEHGDSRVRRALRAQQPQAGLSLEELEERAAGRRFVPIPICQSELVDRARVSPPPASRNAFDSARRADCLGPFGRRRLEHDKGPFRRSFRRLERSASARCLGKMSRIISRR